MIASSAVFYGWWDWRFCGLIGVSIVGNWAAGRVVEDATESKKWLVRSAVVANLGVLGFFKYYGFFALSLMDLVGSNTSDPPLPLLSIVLPIGISFYTFQALSYVLDVSRGRIRSASLLDVAVYLSFFPQLVAGPIVRASEFLPQLKSPSTSSTVPSAEAIWLIGRGLFKKVVVSTYLAKAAVDAPFAGPGAASRQELWIGMYSYAIQIYADFSGYTDIAIGLALLLGFRFPQNFDNPYRATSMQDFWRRWHQTLSTWLRDYLYIPLGGNRRGQLFTYRNLLLTMVLGGLWHGAAWTFVVWGLIHGIALTIERLGGPQRGTQTSARERLLGTAQWLITFHVVCLAWVFFRAENLTEALQYLSGLLTNSSRGEIPLGPVLVVVGAICFQFAPAKIALNAKAQLTKLHPAVQGSLLGTWIALVVALGPKGISPFIYFQF